MDELDAASPLEQPQPGQQSSDVNDAQSPSIDGKEEVDRNKSTTASKEHGDRDGHTIEQQHHIVELTAQLRHAVSRREKAMLRQQLRRVQVHDKMVKTSEHLWRQTYECLTRRSEQTDLDSTIVLEPVVLDDTRQLTWLDDPQTIVAEVFQHTKCRMQLPTQGWDEGASIRSPSFSSFTLLGTKRQIDAAKLYIATSGHFSSHSAQAASSSTPHVDTDPVLDSLIRADDRQELTQDVVEAQTPIRRPLGYLFRSTMTLDEALEAVETTENISALELVTLIASLVKTRPAQDLARVKAAHNSRRLAPLVSSALVTALTRFGSKVAVSKSAASLAFTFMAHHQLHPKIWQVVKHFEELAAQGRGFPSQDIVATAYACTLESCASAGDCHRYLRTLRSMTSRGISVDPRVWQSFYTLTATCLPDKLETVERKMSELGLLEDEATATRVSTQQILRRLWNTLEQSTPIDADDSSLIQNFLAAEQARNPDSMKLTKTGTTHLLRMLVRRGLWESSFYFLEQSQLTGLAFSQCCDTLLQVATAEPHQGARNVTLCLHRLASIARARNMLDVSGGFLSSTTYARLFFYFAYHVQSWNLCRTIWQHACHADRLTPRMVNAMRASFKIADFRRLSKNIPAETHLWNANFARFAMSRHPSDVTTRSGSSLHALTLQDARNETPRPPGSLISDVMLAWEKDRSLQQSGVWPPKQGQKMDKLLEVIARHTDDALTSDQVHF